MLATTRISVLLFFFGFLIQSCRKDPVIDTGGGNNTTVDPVVYNPDWTDASHGNVTPNYAEVFPQESVNRLDITLGSAHWQTIRNSMVSLYGFDFGGGGSPGGGGFPSGEPAYVDVTLKYKGKSWKNVGFRLKGNSSLRSAWSSGNYKMPFRLNFDEFEDAYPGILNQHFYGFEEMSFSPGFKDQSLIREKLTADIFRLGGIPAPQTAFYRVYVDLGAGLKYWGVYCGIEIPDDNMVKSQFGEESGNLYKPESALVNFVQSQFEKKNNETAADYADVQSFVTTLNSPVRTTNPAQWKANLEALFDVSHFLKYLAINNTVVNWDTYGKMAHNYYLYNHSVRKLTWIPWDNNEALSGSPGITGSTQPGPPTPGGGPTGLSLSMNEVGNNWPLIRYLINDPAYLQQYKDALKGFRNTVFLQADMEALIDKYFLMVTPYAIGPEGEQSGYTYLTSAATFTSSQSALKTHVSSRRALVNTYVP